MPLRPTEARPVAGTSTPSSDVLVVFRALVDPVTDQSNIVIRERRAAQGHPTANGRRVRADLQEQQTRFRITGDDASEIGLEAGLVDNRVERFFGDKELPRESRDSALDMAHDAIRIEDRLNLAGKRLDFGRRLVSSIAHAVPVRIGLIGVRGGRAIVCVIRHTIGIAVDRRNGFPRGSHAVAIRRGHRCRAAAAH